MASALTDQLAGRTADTGTAPPAITPRRRKATRQQRQRTYRLADSAMLLAAIVTAVLAAPGPATRGTSSGAPATQPLTLLILEGRGFYGFRLQDTPVDTIARIFAATSIAVDVADLRCAHS